MKKAYRFRAVLTPLEAVTVPTVYGELVFPMRGVRVLDGAGAQVGYFACEDTPEAFDAEASRAGYRRVGYADGHVWLEPLSPPRLASPVAVASVLWQLFRLVLFAGGLIIGLIILAAVVAALFY